MQPLCETRARGPLYALRALFSLFLISIFLPPTQADDISPTLSGFTFPFPSPNVVGFQYLDETSCDVGETLHPGEDLADSRGDVNIRAIADGQVTFVHREHSTTGFGNHLEIKHSLPDGTHIYSHYAHLDTINNNTEGIPLDVGDEIQKGYILGTMGSTGRSTGLHLHFEIRLQELSPDAWPTCSTNLDLDRDSIINEIDGGDVPRYAAPINFLIFSEIEDEVVLFEHSFYRERGALVRFQSGGLYNLPDFLNDRASSIAIPKGWKVIVYKHADKGGGIGERKEISSNDVNFSNDQFDDGTPLNDNISAIEIFPNKVDVFLLVDLSQSFADDLPVFKALAPSMISVMKSLKPNIRFGLGKFEDYPIPPFGDPASGDKAYERLVDLTDDTDLVLATIDSLSIRHGRDGPESQQAALFQAATGAGQDLSGVGFPEASIPPGQQANFRPEAAKLILLWTDAPFHQPGEPGTIPYPGPSFDEAVAAIEALDRSGVIVISSSGRGVADLTASATATGAKVIGISSGGGGTADLEAIAAATDAFAPAGGVDCNNDGIIDIPAGEPLVCSIGVAGEGIAEAMIALTEAAAEPPTSPSCQNPASALPDTSVTASSFQAPNVPENTRDGNLDTRWSAEGSGQWILYDLGTPTTVGQVFIAWHQGDTRTARFAIEVSMDAATWTPVFSGRSSGITVGREVYDFPDVPARFVRIVGFGNSANAWNSITEVDIYGADSDPHAFLPVASLRASDFQSPNAPDNTLDNDFSTRWSAEGDGQWIEYDLGIATPFNQVLIAWYRGDLRQAAFDIEISIDALTWTPVFSGNSSGTTPALQVYDFTEVTARFVRIIGRRNTENDWGSLTEVRIRSCRN